MRFSYSRVESFKQCPQKYKYRYVDELRTLPDQDASNPLYLGVGLHRGIETTVEEGVAEYRKNFYVLTDEIINWSLQLEYWVPKVKELLPANGKQEEEIKVDNFIGYIDYLTDDTIYDFKFTVPKNHPRYMESKQLHVYKHYLELQDAKCNVEHLKYIFIPKCNIRQKKSETIQQFRSRLYAEMDKLEIEVVEIDYDAQNISQFLDDCKVLEAANDYPKNVTRLCGWCDYEPYCLRGEDWMLYGNERD